MLAFEIAIMRCTICIKRTCGTAIWRCLPKAVHARAQQQRLHEICVGAPMLNKGNCVELAHALQSTKSNTQYQWLLLSLHETLTGNTMAEHKQGCARTLSTILSSLLPPSVRCRAHRMRSLADNFTSALATHTQETWILRAERYRMRFVS